MTRWSPQLYRARGIELGANAAVLANALAVAEITSAVDPNLPPVFTLRHLAYLCGVEYGFLRAIVSRENHDPYRIFRLRKRPAENGERRFRVITIPNPSLLKAQRWIAQAILSKVKPHHASVAFSKGDTLLAATKPHCGCKWLIKLDVRNFFESINEISAYRVFQMLGYQPLMAFELARLCTRLGGQSPFRMRPRWNAYWGVRTTITAYQSKGLGPDIGHLPQGAPTSPMLANLAVRDLDNQVAKIADSYGLIYTRYADDLTLSTSDDFSKKQASEVIGKIYAAFATVGLSPNVTKTRVRPPGSRKIVLGLLVDGAEPRLQREFKSSLRQHLYYLAHAKVGPSAHAQKRGFSSVTGMRHHLEGLIAHATQIEEEYGRQCAAKLKAIDWPL